MVGCVCVPYVCVCFKPDMCKMKNGKDLCVLYYQYGGIKALALPAEALLLV